MESRRGNQEYRMGINKTARTAASNVGSTPGWQSYRVFNSIEGPTSVSRPGSSSDMQYAPECQPGVSGRPNTHSPFLGISSTMMYGESTMPQIAALDQWALHERGANYRGTSNVLNQGAYISHNVIDSLYSHNNPQGSMFQDSHHHSDYIRTWPQGGIHGYPPHHLGSEEFDEGNNSPVRQPVDTHLIPPGVQLPGLPILSTPSPDRSNHDSPVAPDTPYQERIADFITREDSWTPEKVYLGSDASVTNGNGHTQITKDRETPNQNYHSHGQWISLNWWKSTLFPVPAGWNLKLVLSRCKSYRRVAD